jgi:UDP-N-acetyl-D-mannosaminuronate dehydrogenase
MDVLKERGVLLRLVRTGDSPDARTPALRRDKIGSLESRDDRGFDAVVIATAHASVNYQELAEWAPRIVDTRNAMASARVSRDKVWKA